MSKKSQIPSTEAWWMPAARHLGVIVAFLLLLVIYFKPIVFDGMVVSQSDIVSFKGMSKEVSDYRANKGEEALWTNSQFSGMPAFQIGTRYYNNLFYTIHNTLFSWLPNPVSLLFLTFLGFWFLLATLRMGPWLSGIGAAAFTLSSYFFIIMEAGHTSKLAAMGYMGPVIAGVLLAYRGKYLIGGLITALFFALQITVNHFQITYYMGLVILILFIAYLIDAIQKGEIFHFMKASAVLLVAALLGVGPNIGRLWTTYEYAQETIRGKSELTPDANNPENGLDIEYALRWSYGVGETFTLLIPNFYGGASGSNLGKNSETYKVLKKNYGVKTADQATERWPTYWGDQPFTSGPVYVGALICFLFVLGLLIVPGPLRWALLAATLLAFMLSWGRNMMGFTELFFHHFPMYNKFRAPAMILVLAEFTMPLLGIMALGKILKKDTGLDKESLLKRVYIAAGVTGGLALLFALAGSMFFSFTAEGDLGTLTRIFRLQANSPVLQDILAALHHDRASMLRMDALRSAFFILLGSGLLWLFIKEKIKAPVMLAGIALVVLADMVPVNYRYLNDGSFVKENTYQGRFRPSRADQAIFQDKGLSYRVLNLTSDTFNESITAYHHKSVGGYHAAKLRRYQDLIERHIGPEMGTLTGILQSQPSDSVLTATMARLSILNMLNTRYFIINPDGPPLPNSSALGNAWFVNEYKMVADPDAEMAALDNLDPSRTAVVDKQFEDLLSGLKITVEPAASIKLTQYDPKELVYEVNSGGEQLIVFSEIYYNDEKGWKAYIDGEPVPHFRADYVLRAMRYPGGKHTVTFRFHPRSFHTGETFSLLFSLILLLGAGAVFFLEYRKRQTKREN